MITAVNESTKLSQEVKASSNGELLVKLGSQSGNNEQVYDGSAAWANSSSANTNKDIDITPPTTLQVNGLYAVTVINPSAVTALTVVAQNKGTFGGSAKYSTLAQFSVAANTNRTVIVQGWMLGEGARLTLSNDTGLGVADGFTAYVRVRKV